MLIAAVLMGGCMTPAKVAEETPGVLANVSANISESVPEVTIPNMLKPIETMVGYTQTPTPAPTTVIQSGDPIVGNWKYVGNAPYQCSATFTPDGICRASCYESFIPLRSETFTWTTTPSSYNWIRSYTLTAGNTTYTAMYSEHTGYLTSSLIPGEGYLTKVN